jgi:hypothetical protein
MPKLEAKEYVDDTTKKIGIGALLGVLMHNAFK